MDNSVIKTNISVSSDSIKMQERLAIFLALIAGYIDATGLIQWKTYVSFMSGNTTSLGAAISTGKYGIIITSITVISCFLLGIYADWIFIWCVCRPFPTRLFCKMDFDDSCIITNDLRNVDFKK